MSIDLEATFSAAVESLLSRRAGLLAVAFVALGLLSAVAATTAQARAIDLLLANDAFVAESPSASIERLRTLRSAAAPLTAPIPLWAASATVLATFVARELVRLVGIRLFAAEDPDRLATTELTRRLGVALAVDVVLVVLLGALFGLVFAVAGLAFVVPPLGLLALLVAVAVVVFLSVSFAFAKQEIALNDVGPLAALSASWQVTAGHRLSILVLLVLLALLNVLARVVSALVAGVLPRVVATGVGTVVGAVVLALSIAVVTKAYRAVTTADSDDGGEDSEFDDPPGVDADW